MISVSQFEGCLLGLAVADAIAAPWEGLTADLIFSLGPAESIVKHESDETIYYTDDTQMMISIALNLINEGEIIIDKLALLFAENYHPDRGYGQGARTIINAIGNKEDWQLVAQALFGGKGSLGNGAAMRVAPIGLFYSHNQSTIEEQSVLSALVTHTHQVGIDGARILATAVRLSALSNGIEINRKSFLNDLLKVAKTEEFQWQISHALKIKPFDSLSSFGNSLEAHRSVLTSIMCFLDSPDDYSTAIKRAISQGNDVDTLASMTGALSGARLGINAIPKNLLDCLEDKHQGRTFIFNLAKNLWARYRAKN